MSKSWGPIAMGGGKNGRRKETNSFLYNHCRSISVRMSIIVNKTLRFSNCFLLFNTRPFRRMRKCLTSSRLLARVFLSPFPADHSAGGTMSLGERNECGLVPSRSSLSLQTQGKLNMLATFPWHHPRWSHHVPVPHPQWQPPSWSFCINSPPVPPPPQLILYKETLVIF